MSTTLAYHIKAKAITQYVNYPFTGLCVFNGVPLGISDVGLHKLDTGDTDSGEEISAGIGLPPHNFGLAEYKRIRALYVFASLTGDLVFKVTSDGDHSEEYVLEATSASAMNVPKGYKIFCRRKKTLAQVFTIELANSRGSYFVVSSLAALIIKLGMKK